MKKYFIPSIILLSLLACQKQNLDGLAFPSEKLESYEFENYNARQNSVPEQYAITSANRTLITLDSKDQKTGETYQIYGVYIGNLDSISVDTVILYCHGQSKHMDAYWPRASLLANLINKYHYGVFMMDYRGYGRSEGSSSESGLSEDVDASIEWLKSQGADETRTIYYGFSLGCIPAIERAAFKTNFTSQNYLGITFGLGRKPNTYFYHN